MAAVNFDLDVHGEKIKGYLRHLDPNMSIAFRAPYDLSAAGSRVHAILPPPTFKITCWWSLNRRDVRLLNEDEINLVVELVDIYLKKEGVLSSSAALLEPMMIGNVMNSNVMDNETSMQITWTI